MWKVIQEAIPLMENCILPSAVNDEYTLSSWRQLEDLISRSVVDRRLYRELATLIERGAGPINAENMLAALWLSEIGDEHAVEILLDALASDAYTTQFAAAWGLRRLTDSKTTRERLIAFYIRNRNRDFAGQLLQAIIQVSGSSISEWIAQEIHFGVDTPILIAACRALSNVVAHKSFAISTLHDIALQGEYPAKIAAGYSLAILNDSVGVDILLEGLRNANTAEELDWILMYSKNLSIPEAYQIIVGLMRHPNDEIKLRAIDALGPYGIPDAVNHLVESISGRNEEVDHAALSAIDWIVGISRIASYEEIEENYRNRDWLAGMVRTACPDMRAKLRYWHGKLLNPSILLEDLGASSLTVPEVAFAQLRFSYGFLFHYDSILPWVFFKEELQGLGEMIDRNSARFTDGNWYMFGHKVT